MTANSPGWSRILGHTDVRGALVLRVMADSPASRLNLVPGDVLRMIDGKAVTNEEQVSTLFKAVDSSSHSILLAKRDGRSEELTAQLSDAPLPSVGAFLQEIPEQPDPATRLLYAQTSSDPTMALSVVDQLVADLPMFAQAHVERGSLLTQALLNRIGSEKLGADQLTAIEKATRTAVELDVRSLEIHLTSARIYLDLGRFDLGHNLATAALRLDPNSAKALALQGRASILLGRFEDAARSFARAIDLNPFSRDYYQGLSQSFSALGLERQANQTRRAAFPNGTGASEQNASSQEISDKTQPIGLALAAMALLGLGFPWIARRREEAATGTRSEHAHGPTRTGLALVLAEIVFALGVWTALIPYVGRELGLARDTPYIFKSPTKASIVDLAEHLVPGLIIALGGGLIVYGVLRSKVGRMKSLPFVPITCALAGLWLAVSHIRLFQFAVDGAVPWESTLFHMSSAIPITVLSLWLRRNLIFVDE